MDEKGEGWGEVNKEGKVKINWFSRTRKREVNRRRKEWVEIASETKGGSGGRERGKREKEKRERKMHWGREE